MNGKIAANIKKYREACGLTQKQLADAIGKSKNVISNWENGLNNPDPDTIELLLGIFKIDANTFLGWDNSEQIKKEAEALADEIISNGDISKVLPGIIGLSDEELTERIKANDKIKDIISLMAELSTEDLDLVENFIKRLSK